MKEPEAGGAPAAEPKPVAEKGISEIEKKAPSGPKAKGEKKEGGDEVEAAAAAAPATTTTPPSMKEPEAGGAPAAEPKPVAAKDQQAATAKGISEIEKKAPSGPKAKGEKKEGGDEVEAAPLSPYEAIGPAIQAVNKRTKGLAKHSAPTVPGSICPGGCQRQERRTNPICCNSDSQEH